MSDPFIWLQFAAPLLTVAAGAFVYWFTARQRHPVSRSGCTDVLSLR